MTTGPQNPATAFAGTRHLSTTIDLPNPEALGAIGSACPANVLAPVPDHLILIERALIRITATTIAGDDWSIGLLYTDADNVGVTMAAGTFGATITAATVDAFVNLITVANGEASSFRNRGIGVGIAGGNRPSALDATAAVDLNYRLLKLPA